MRNKTNKLTIIALVVAFLGPIIGSWWVLNYTNVVTEGSKSNHGDLIVPPRAIEDLVLLDPMAKKEYRLYGKWNIVYVAKSCDKACIDNLYRMRQIHTAMDKHSLRVQRVLFLTEQTEQNLPQLFANYAGQRIIMAESRVLNRLLEQFRLTETDKPLSMERLYIIDPQGNLMMSFEADANPRGIMKDLKTLLRASRIG